MDNPFKSPSILSLCPGMLGLERGFERVIGRTRTVAYVEIEAFIIENLVQQMEQGVLAAAPIWSNVKTFPWKKFRGKIHWIIGGYPCQPFSHVGRQKGVEDPRHIWPYIKSGINAIRPMGCFFENVSNHLNIGYDQVKNDLEELGYRVEQGLFTAAEVGAPHIRKRLFILALDNSFQSRLEGHARNDSREEGWQGSIRSITKTMFPLGQGYDQWGWEAPRVESRMGVTINGYNYREDLLRMAGNAVVEQQAELALRTLLMKFLVERCIQTLT